ncbi:GNAT family N-acetyltransferase [Tomitella biformata]|uniref:GNAT family N-acetyltransferase n=1 Tax=Tomitella biformata TaxID=630403 RepID=UPI000462F671|nr:GNAT family N-acetyltransferase [Tomitella biformata]
MTKRIVHNTDLERFEIYVKDDVGAYADYMDIGDTRNFDHTVTKQRFEGHGLATELIGFALAQTRSEGRKIVTSCSFVRGYIDTHPEYNDLVA